MLRLEAVPKIVELRALMTWLHIVQSMTGSPSIFGCAGSVDMILLIKGRDIRERICKVWYGYMDGKAPRVTLQFI